MKSNMFILHQGHVLLDVEKDENGQSQALEIIFGKEGKKSKCFTNVQHNPYPDFFLYVMEQRLKRTFFRSRFVVGVWKRMAVGRELIRAARKNAKKSYRSLKRLRKHFGLKMCSDVDKRCYDSPFPFSFFTREINYDICCAYKERRDLMSNLKAARRRRRLQRLNEFKAFQTENAFQEKEEKNENFTSDNEDRKFEKETGKDERTKQEEQNKGRKVQEHGKPEVRRECEEKSKVQSKKTVIDQKMAEEDSKKHTKEKRYLGNTKESIQKNLKHKNHEKNNRKKSTSTNPRHEKFEKHHQQGDIQRVNTQKEKKLERNGESKFENSKEQEEKKKTEKLKAEEEKTEKSKLKQRVEKSKTTKETDFDRKKEEYLKDKKTTKKSQTLQKSFVKIVEKKETKISITEPGNYVEEKNKTKTNEENSESLFKAHKRDIQEIMIESEEKPQPIGDNFKKKKLSKTGQKFARSSDDENKCIVYQIHSKFMEKVLNNDLEKKEQMKSFEENGNKRKTAEGLIDHNIKEKDNSTTEYGIKSITQEERSKSVIRDKERLKEDEKKIKTLKFKDELVEVGNQDEQNIKDKQDRNKSMDASVFKFKKKNEKEKKENSKKQRNKIKHNFSGEKSEGKEEYFKTTVDKKEQSKDEEIDKHVIKQKKERDKVKYEKEMSAKDVPEEKFIKRRKCIKTKTELIKSDVRNRDTLEKTEFPKNKILVKDDNLKKTDKEKILQTKNHFHKEYLTEEKQIEVKKIVKEEVKRKKDEENLKYFTYLPEATDIQTNMEIFKRNEKEKMNVPRHCNDERCFKENASNERPNHSACKVYLPGSKSAEKEKATHIVTEKRECALVHNQKEYYEEKEKLRKDKDVELKKTDENHNTNILYLQDIKPKHFQEKHAEKTKKRKKEEILLERSVKCKVDKDTEVQAETERNTKNLIKKKIDRKENDIKFLTIPEINQQIQGKDKKSPKQSVVEQLIQEEIKRNDIPAKSDVQTFHKQTLVQHSLDREIDEKDEVKKSHKQFELKEMVPKEIKTKYILDKDKLKQSTNKHLVEKEAERKNLKKKFSKQSVVETLVEKEVIRKDADKKSSKQKEVERFADKEVKKRDVEKKSPKQSVVQKVFDKEVKRKHADNKSSKHRVVEQFVAEEVKRKDVDNKFCEQTVIEQFVQKEVKRKAAEKKSDNQSLVERFVDKEVKKRDIEKSLKQSVVEQFVEKDDKGIDAEKESYSDCVVEQFVREEVKRRNADNKFDDQVVVEQIVDKEVIGKDAEKSDNQSVVERLIDLCEVKRRDAEKRSLKQSVVEQFFGEEVEGKDLYKKPSKKSVVEQLVEREVKIKDVEKSIMMKSSEMLITKHTTSEVLKFEPVIARDISSLNADHFTVLNEEEKNRQLIKEKGVEIQFPNVAEEINSNINDLKRNFEDGEICEDGEIRKQAFFFIESKLQQEIENKEIKEKNRPQGTQFVEDEERTIDKLFKIAGVEKNSFKKNNERDIHQKSQKRESKEIEEGEIVDSDEEPLTKSLEKEKMCKQKEVEENQSMSLKRRRSDIDQIQEKKRCLSI